MSAYSKYTAEDVLKSKLRMIRRNHLDKILYKGSSGFKVSFDYYGNHDLYNLYLKLIKKINRESGSSGVINKVKYLQDIRDAWNEYYDYCYSEKQCSDKRSKIVRNLNLSELAYKKIALDLLYKFYNTDTNRIKANGKIFSKSLNYPVKVYLTKDLEKICNADKFYSNGVKKKNMPWYYGFAGSCFYKNLVNDLNKLI